MNVVKFAAKLTCLLLISCFLHASNQVAVPLVHEELSDGSDVDVAGPDHKEGPSESASFHVVSDQEDQAGRDSGASSGSGSSGNLRGSSDSADGDSDDSDDFMIETTKKWWQSAREKINKYPYTTAVGAATLLVGGLYKFHKPFRNKVNNARDKIKMHAQKFWKKQKEQPLTVGSVARLGAGAAAVYGAYKIRLVPQLLTPVYRAARYVQDLDFSQKCILGAGLACSGLACSWLYSKFSKAKPADQVNSANVAK